MPKEKTNPTPPLEEQAIDKLDAALKAHIDRLYNKLEYRQEVHKATPYTYEEVLEMCFPSGSKKNLYEWYRYCLNNYKVPKSIQVTGKLSNIRNLDPDFQQCLAASNPKTAFIALFEQESNDYLSDTEYNPFEYEGVRRWKPDYARVLKTLIEHGYPFEMPFEDVLSINYYTTNAMKNCNDIISVIFHRFVILHTIPKRLEKTGIPLITLDQLINLYYPNQEDMAALMLMLQFQAGWNKETVIALDKEDFEHSLSGMVDETQRIITSEKKRGQNTHLPYLKPKTMLAVSDTKDKYSIYKLIKLAEELSAPLTQLNPYELPKLQKQLNPLFVCTTDHSDWSKKARFGSLDSTKTSTRGVRDFLKTNEITHNGKRLTQSGELVSKIRPTWIYIKRKTEPLSLVQLAAGHASSETTDVHYDSSEQSIRTRKERLSHELSKLMEKFKSRKFAGLMPIQRTKEDDKTLTIFSIPGHNRELWACRDQRFRLSR